MIIQKSGFVVLVPLGIIIRWCWLTGWKVVFHKLQKSLLPILRAFLYWRMRHRQLFMVCVLLMALFWSLLSGDRHQAKWRFRIQVVILCRPQVLFPIMWMVIIGLWWKTKWALELFHRKLCKSCKTDQIRIIMQIPIGWMLYCVMLVCTSIICLYQEVMKIPVLWLRWPIPIKMVSWWRQE